MEKGLLPGTDSAD